MSLLLQAGQNFHSPRLAQLLTPGVRASEPQSLLHLVHCLA